MKKILQILFLLIIISTNAQYVSIPDSIFEQKLIDLGIDSDQTLNGQILTADAQNVTTLNISNNNGNFIQDLTGIEAFVNLDTLICNENILHHIDLSNNTHLKYLDLYQTGLQSLDISNLTSLEFLKCSNEVQADYISDTFNHFQSLDLTNNTSLKTLICNQVGLHNITFSTTSTLEYVELVKHQVNTMDLSVIPGLKHLDMSLSVPIQNLDLSNNVLLEYLDINKSNYTNVDLSNNTKLKTLLLGYFYVSSGAIEEYNNDNQFSSIDLSELTELKTLSARKTGLTSIDLSHNTNLEFISISKNDLHNINISQNTNLKILDVNDCALTNIDLTHNQLLEELYLGYYDRFPDNITNFLNNINTLDTSHNINLIKLIANNIQLNNVDLSQNSNLSELFLNENNLSNIDISGNSALLAIGVSNNNIADLNTLNNPNLTYINISYNPITSFDILNNPTIQQLFCTNTLLESLDLKNGHNDILQDMVATNNPNLSCIQVDDLIYTNNPGIYYGWQKDVTAVYSTNCSTQSIYDNKNVKLNIYPNPANDVLFLENNDSFENVLIYNLQGQLVRNASILSDNSINVKDIQNGLYILKLNNKKMKINKKIIIQH